MFLGCSGVVCRPNPSMAPTKAEYASWTYYGKPRCSRKSQIAMGTTSNGLPPLKNDINTIWKRVFK